MGSQLKSSINESEFECKIFDVKAEFEERKKIDQNLSYDQFLEKKVMSLENAKLSSRNLRTQAAFDKKLSEMLAQCDECAVRNQALLIAEWAGLHQK